MRTIENTTLYVCDFCKKKMQRKHAMILHEEHCTMNPKNVSACAGCAHMKEGTIDVYYYDSIRTCKTFHCNKLNKDLYPYKVVRKGLLQKYPESYDGMELMPNKCEHWSYFNEFKLLNKDILIN